MDRNRRSLCLASLLIVSVTTSLGAQDSRIEGIFEHAVRVHQPVSLEVFNSNGNTTIRPGRADEIRVVAAISAGTRWDCDERESAEKVRTFETTPAIERDGDRVRIGWWDDPDMGKCTLIDYRVWVPRWTALNVRHVHGEVDISDADESVSIVIVSGGRAVVRQPQDEVRIEGRGTFEVAGRPRGAWTLNTEVGELNLLLPEDAQVDLDAEVNRGWIESDFPISIRDGGDGTVLRGAINGGGPRLTLRSGHGPIHIEPLESRR